VVRKLGDKVGKDQRYSQNKCLVFRRFFAHSKKATNYPERVKEEMLPEEKNDQRALMKKKIRRFKKGV